ncbi:hypothetical protein HY947_01470 [Candidatus Gottesmanbacteria bacterium]|nr:hypothetical protein [Candidatus Gottesmanbacteria bacterium]
MHQLALFQGKQIRRTIHNKEWWFSVVDIVGALTDSLNPRDYWYKMKIREKDESGTQLSTNCLQLKLEAPDGKMRETNYRIPRENYARYLSLLTCVR